MRKSLLGGYGQYTASVSEVVPGRVAKLMIAQKGKNGSLDVTKDLDHFAIDSDSESDVTSEASTPSSISSVGLSHSTESSDSDSLNSKSLDSIDSDIDNIGEEDQMPRLIGGGAPNVGFGGSHLTALPEKPGNCVEHSGPRRACLLYTSPSPRD